MKNLRIPVSKTVSLTVRHRPADGPGAPGRPFVLLHGLLSNARMWDEVAERLAAAGHPVYAVDQRGHGASDAPPDGYVNETVVADLVAVADALELEGALYAGHSWGGHLALHLTVEHPRLVAGLALVDGGWYEFDGPVMRAFWERTTDMVRRAQEGTTSAADMRAYLKATHPDWSQAAVEARLADYHISPEGLLIPRLTAEQVTSIVHSLQDESPGELFPKVSVPTLLLAVMPPIPQLSEQVRTWVADAEAALDRVRLRWYPGTDHDVHAGAPDEVAADLLRLAGEAEPASPAG